MVMDISLFDQVAKSCEALGVDLSAGDLASYVVSNKLSEAQVTAITDLFRELEQKKYQTAIETLLRLSRLPTKVPQRFRVRERAAYAFGDPCRKEHRVHWTARRRKDTSC